MEIIRGDAYFGDQVPYSPGGERVQHRSDSVRLYFGLAKEVDKHDGQGYQ